MRKVPLKFLAKRPKRFGWKSVKPVKSAKRVRRCGWKVPAEYRADLEPLRELRVKGEGYLLAPCLVLWATVFYTREAYEFAMANMAAARAHDFRRNHAN